MGLSQSFTCCDCVEPQPQPPQLPQLPQLPNIDTEKKQKIKIQLKNTENKKEILDEKNDQFHTNDLMMKTFDDLDLFSYEGLLSKAKVVDVYDGDTVTIVFYDNHQPVKQHFRMLGYDSPEMKPKKDIEHRDLHIQAAKIARDKLAKLVRNELVWIRFAKQEKYGRLMGTMYLITSSQFSGNEKNINELMIQKGLGKAYDGGRKNPFTKDELLKIIKQEI